jgi:hypothetical protein
LYIKIWFWIPALNIPKYKAWDSICQWFYLIILIVCVGLWATAFKVKGPELVNSLPLGIIFSLLAAHLDHLP